ncbi:MAG: hypothetical protein Fur006_23670 [Coleofasciculaceae cyanobacterium]
MEQVYELWGDMQNIPRWMPLVKEVKILPGDENLSHWKFGLGAPLLTEWTSRITQRIPLRLIAWEIAAPDGICTVFKPKKFSRVQIQQIQ